MKRILYWPLASLILTFAACGSNDENRVGEPDPGKREWSLFAATNTSATPSRVAIGEPSGGGDVRPLQWQADDKITVFDGSVMAQFILTDTQTGEFTGASGDLANDNDYFAVLGRQGEYSAVTGKITFTMPETVVVDGSGGHLSDYMILFADNSFRFQNNVASGVDMSCATSVLHLKLQLAEGDADRELVSLEMQSPSAGHFVKKATVDADADMAVEESFDKLVLNFNPALGLTASSSADIQIIVLVNPDAASPTGDFKFTLTDSNDYEVVIEKPAFALAAGTYYNSPVIKPAGQWAREGDEPDDPDPDISQLDFVSLVTADNAHYPANWTASLGPKIYDVSGGGIYEGYVFAGYERDQSVAALVSSDEQVYYSFNAYSILADGTCSSYAFVEFPYPGDGMTLAVACPFVTWDSGSGVWKIRFDVNTLECFIMRTEWNISGTATGDTTVAMTHSGDPENDIWSVTTDLAAGEFKFVTSPQTDVNSQEPVSITLGKVSQTKVSETGAGITVAESGSYTVTLDVSNAKSRYSITKN